MEEIGCWGCRKGEFECVTVCWKPSLLRHGEGLVASLLMHWLRSLVYVEGEARMRKFEKEGKTESALSIVQRE